MKDSLEHVFQNRLNTIAEAFKANYSGANSLSNLPKEQVYKHVSRYSCAGSDCANADEAFRIDMSKADVYCVKNVIWQDFLAMTLFKYDVDYFGDIPVINRSKDTSDNIAAALTKMTANQRAKRDCADIYARDKKRSFPRSHCTTIKSP